MLTFAVIAIVYFTYKYIKGPTKRAIDKTTDSVEEIRKNALTKKELERKKVSIEEQAQIKARTLSTKVFERTMAAITDEACRSEVEKLRIKAEERILKINLEEIDRMTREYKESIESLDSSDSLSAKEKSDLYEEIRLILAEA